MKPRKRSSSRRVVLDSDGEDEATSSSAKSNIWKGSEICEEGDVVSPFI